MQSSGGEVLQRLIGPWHVTTRVYQSSPALGWGLPKTSLAVSLSRYPQAPTSPLWAACPFGVRKCWGCF